MAVQTDGRFQIGSSGLSSATSGQFNKFEQHATPKYPIGFKVETADGKIYRYAQFDTTVNRGVLCAQDFSQVSVVDTDNVMIAPASAVAVSDESIKPGTIGSTYIELTLAAVTANQFAGGTLITTDDTGEGYTYDVLGNTATDNPATGTIRLKLAQKLQVAIDTTTDFALVANPWNNIEIATAATDCVIAGVSCVNVAAGTPYAWVQTKGLCGVLQDATVPGLGAPVQLSSATSGAVTAMATTGTVGTLLKTRFVGQCADAGDSTGATSVLLLLE